MDYVQIGGDDLSVEIKMMEDKRKLIILPPSSSYKCYVYVLTRKVINDYSNYYNSESPDTWNCEYII